MVQVLLAKFKIMIYKNLSVTVQQMLLTSALKRSQEKISFKPFTLGAQNQHVIVQVTSSLSVVF